MAKRGYKLQEFVAHASDVNCLNIGKKSSRLLLTGGNDRKVNLWAIGKSMPLLSLSGHSSPVEAVTFDSTEGLILAGANSGAIKLWDLEEAKVVRTLTGHRSKCASLEFHPFGEFFASGSLDANLKIWDIRKKGCIHTYKGHTRGIRTIKFTPDGRWVVSGGEDNVVKVWDLTAGKLLHDFNFHDGVIRSIDFHPHEFLLATGSADRTVKFWDLETFELIGSAGPEGAGVRSMIFHPDGKTLFCGLDESLKVLSWEPVRCHDDLDIRWSTLGDLSMYEGKLLGCSYHQGSIGVWVVDISLIGPYASDAIDRSNDVKESALKPIDKHAIDQRKENAKSFPVNNMSTDQASIVKEIIHTEKVTSNDGKNSLGKVSPAKVSKTNSRISALLSRKQNLSLGGSQTFEDDQPSSRSSTSNLTSVRKSRSTKSFPTPVRSEPNSTLKGTLTNSPRYSGSGFLNLKKKSTVKSCRGTETDSSSTKDYSPLIIPRDEMELNCRKGISLEIDTESTALGKPIHARISSRGVDGSKSWLNATKSLNDLDEVVNSNVLQLTGKSDIKDADGRDQANSNVIAEKFERVVFLDRSFGSHKETSLATQDGSFAGEEMHDSGSDIRPVKYVNGVAIQHGRTRSLVESWEKKDIFNNSYATESRSSSDSTQTDFPPNKLVGRFSFKDKEHSVGKGKESEDGDFPRAILQNHDPFINVLKSRLTKLQMARHCWEQTGVKGTINAIAKLPDHCVQVDVIGTLVDKMDLFDLDLFSCLLPLLLDLLDGKVERYTDISMEMLLKLVKIFGSVICSTLSASLPIGVDIEAEKRRKVCGRCFTLLKKLKEMLPPLIRTRGSLARRAMELNLALQQY